MKRPRRLAVDPAEHVRARLGGTSAYRDLLTLLARDSNRWVRSRRDSCASGMMSSRCKRLAIHAPRR